MKLELNYDEVSTISLALLLKTQEAERNALGCAKFDDMDNDVEFWRDRAKAYRKVYDVVEAQREQADKEYEQAAVALKEEAGV